MARSRGSDEVLTGDTGGLVPDDDALIPREILRQAGVAIDTADLLILVVDARAGLTPLDEELARLLRRSGKPLIVAANKVDTGQQDIMTGPFYEIGVPVFGVSAEHGTGIDDLLDYVLENIKTGDEKEEAKPGDEVPVRVAIIGRPNVGKSTLLNQLAGEERSIVSATAEPRAIPWTHSFATMARSTNLLIPPEFAAKEKPLSSRKS